MSRRRLWCGEWEWAAVEARYRRAFAELDAVDAVRGGQGHAAVRARLAKTRGPEVQR